LYTAKIVSIVDDDESTRTSTASLIRSMGWQARIFESADHLLESLFITGVRHAGCIVSDQQMPGTTGLEMLRTLQEEGYSSTIIFVTAYYSDDFSHVAHSNGALCVLEKPVDPKILCDWLLHALRDVDVDMDRST
jgi:FixJ family two-component response regulator